MIITKEMIEKVGALATEDKLMESYFPSRSAIMDQIFEVKNANLKTQLFCLFHSAHNTKLYLLVPFAHLSYGYNMQITLYDFKKETYHFDCNVYSQDDPELKGLHVYIGAGKIAQRVDAARGEISELITSIIAECKTKLAREDIKERAKWGFDRMERFFNAHQQDGTVDTEKKLKELWKSNSWKESMWVSIDGKNQSFKTMRLVVDEFYETFKQIENNPALYGPKS